MSGVVGRRHLDSVRVRLSVRKAAVVDEMTSPEHTRRWARVSTAAVSEQMQRGLESNTVAIQVALLNTPEYATRAQHEDRHINISRYLDTPIFYRRRSGRYGLGPSQRGQRWRRVSIKLILQQ